MVQGRWNSIGDKGVAGHFFRERLHGGHGEFGGIVATDLAASGIRASVIDILSNSGQSRAAMLEKAKDANVRPCDGLEEAIRSADLVISAVTCSAAADVARNSVQYLRSGQM